jgi:hypothetical protein
MSFSRRQFAQWAAMVSTVCLLEEGVLRATPLPQGSDPKIHTDFLPSQAETWEWLKWMAALGPKFTGNPAHVKYVSFLEEKLTSSGLSMSRDRYTFPRWAAKSWRLSAGPNSGDQVTDIPVTSYFPYSGETGPAGVTGEMLYAGPYRHWDLTGAKGKIVLVECPTQPRPYGNWYELWGTNRPMGSDFPQVVTPARGSVDSLSPFKDAGAVGVVLGWTNVSDANAADQYTPFSRPPQGIPGLYVGMKSFEALKEMANSGGKATLVLNAEMTPDTPTDTLIATLPGNGSSDEVLIVNTHTDGTNATEENGGVAILAIAKYFSQIPQRDRRRTLVFPLTTGHFAGPWVPSIRGFIEKHPDIIHRTVAAVTIEHLACLEWMDNAAMEYGPTGKNQWSIAITTSPQMGQLFLKEEQESKDRVGVVNPVHGGFFGEGGALARLGIPTMGYIPQPSYLLAAPGNGCIDKLDPDLFHSQIEIFVKVISAINTMTKAELNPTGSAPLPPLPRNG